jgi:hypothetical protein
MADDQNVFQFGVEIELLMGSRKKVHPNWKSLAKDLNKHLLKAGIANHINEGNDKSHDNYREWSIVPEVTIPSQPAKNLCKQSLPMPTTSQILTCARPAPPVGLELVSPVFPIYSYWASELNTIFATLHSAFTLHPSPHCSTHVHISGTPTPLSPTELAALAKSVLYYEPALDALMPPTRRTTTAASSSSSTSSGGGGTGGYWCQSNRLNPALAPLASSLPACLAAIDHASSVNPSSARPVVEAVNLFPAASAYGRAHGKTKDFVRGKVYKWDFTGMLGGGRGTVEYRQAPGSLRAEDAAGWVTLAVAFVVGAMAVGPRLGAGHADAEDGATTDELWAMLATGAEAIGWTSLGAVEGLFERSG